MKKLFALIAVVFSVGFPGKLSAQDSVKIVSIDFFAPIAGCMGFNYEKSGDNIFTMEYGAGLIGLKLEDYFEYDQFVGAYASAGPKFYFNTEEVANNLTKTIYFKPLLLLNYYYFWDEGSFYNGSQYISVDYEGFDLSISVLGSLGSQWVLDEHIVFDLWFGLGYGGGWHEVTKGQYAEDADYNEQFNFSYIRIGNTPVAFDGGLSIGWKW